MALITCEINLTLIWSDRCFIKDISNTNQKKTNTDTKLYVPVLTLSFQVNGKLLEQLKSGFKRTKTGIDSNQK